MSDDRATRRFPRVRAERPVLIRLLGDEHPFEELVRTRVIGLGGCCFTSHESLGFSSLIEVLISLETGVVRTDGRVAYEIRRSEAEYEVGVEFLRVNPPGRALLHSLVSASARPSPAAAHA